MRISFDKKNFINNTFLNKKIEKKLSKNFPKIMQSIISDIDNSKKTYNVLSETFKLNINIKDLKKFKKFKSIAIIGMGGSILGIEAIYDFLKYKLKKKIYFFDDINVEKFNFFRKNISKSKTLFIVISKSGNTIETLSNFISLNIIQKNKKNIILISEKKNNTLYQLSKKFNLFYIEHKSYIGGRYSVLSEVGIVPAYLMGINIFKLRKNLKRYLIGKDKNYLKDSVTKISNILLSKKLSNIVFLNYSPNLNKFLFWCQQLIAESLGKKGYGFFPVISKVPKDHHSLLQLYLDGPRDKIFYIFSSKEKSSPKINSKKFTNHLNYINNKNLDQIKTAQKKALINSFRKKKIPYREFSINNFEEETIGELFSYFILEIIFVGKLSKINPFDQPSVEQVKKSTIKILN